jgi:hypothetical protein
MSESCGRMPPAPIIVRGGGSSAQPSGSPRPDGRPSPQKEIVVRGEHGVTSISEAFSEGEKLDAVLREAQQEAQELVDWAIEHGHRAPISSPGHGEGEEARGAQAYLDLRTQQARQDKRTEKTEKAEQKAKSDEEEKKHRIARDKDNKKKKRQLVWDSYDEPSEGAENQVPYRSQGFHEQAGVVIID